MATGKLTVSQGGTSNTVKDQAYPPLERIWTPGPHAHAEVGFDIGTQRNMGDIKLMAHVRYECDQTNDRVNEAALLAFDKAVEILNDGLKIFGLDGVGS